MWVGLHLGLAIPTKQVLSCFLLCWWKFSLITWVLQFCLGLLSRHPANILPCFTLFYWHEGETLETLKSFFVCLFICLHVKFWAWEIFFSKGFEVRTSSWEPISPKIAWTLKTDTRLAKALKSQVWRVRAPTRFCSVALESARMPQGRDSAQAMRACVRSKNSHALTRVGS